ncbi:MAG: hypothetical protein K2P88_00290 [Chitinophagaceae bacterium]|uniref:Uncharacterized protein n=1 Tax=marine sediment metagenome TaxID=412755 RepID=X1SUE6_9ZZZZ|nr:hypothetical protein [Chitinophagaceae bacterium]
MNVSRTKLLNLLVILTSLIGYLEWEGNNHLFLAQGEYEIIYKFFTDPKATLHPFILLPLLGQLLLVVTLLQKYPKKMFIYVGMASIALLLSFVLLIGFLEMNWKIILSILPFHIVCILNILHTRKLGKAVPQA